MNTLEIAEDGIARCGWVGDNAEYRRYHDEEWGRPLRDGQALYEKLCLEGFQAGLSWITILRKRPAFREAFHGFHIDTVAAMTEQDIERLVFNAGIIRHRGKITSTIKNARITQQLGPDGLRDLIWSFAPAAGSRSRPETVDDVPASTDASVALSKALRAQGYGFVGPTTMYALMQSAGLVDDHVHGCHRAQ